MAGEVSKCSQPFKKIILFGASSGGRKALFFLKTKADIICFIDNSKELTGKFIEGIEVKHPAQIKEIKFDEIIICSSYHGEITEQLINEYKIPQKKIKVLSASVMKGTKNIGEINRFNAANNIIKTIAETYNDHKIFYYIDHGTLLGIIRNGDLLHWDNDVDIAINAEDFQQAYLAIKNKFPPPYEVKKIYKESEDCSQTVRLIRIEYERQAIADILLKEKSGEKRLWYVGFTQLEVSDKIHGEIKKINFHGVSVNIPKKPENYLSILYGNWKEKIEDWNHSMYKNIRGQK